MTRPGWPSIPANDSTTAHDFALALYQAQLSDLVNQRNAEYQGMVAREARDASRSDQAVTSEDRLREAVHAAYLDVAKSALDRMLKRADMLVTIAAGAATIYTAVLGLAFSADVRPIAPVAALPALFLALALVMSAFYSAFVSRRVRHGMPLASGTSAKVQHRRLAEFVAWVNGTALDRGWALQSAILCLFVGTVSMPIAFVDRGQDAYAVAVILLAALGTAVLIRANHSSRGGLRD